MTHSSHNPVREGGRRRQEEEAGSQKSKDDEGGQFYIIVRGYWRQDSTDLTWKRCLLLGFRDSNFKSQFPIRERVME